MSQRVIPAGTVKVITSDSKLKFFNADNAMWAADNQVLVTAFTVLVGATLATLAATIFNYRASEDTTWKLLKSYFIYAGIVSAFFVVILCTWTVYLYEDGTTSGTAGIPGTVDEVVVETN